MKQFLKYISLFIYLISSVLYSQEMISGKLYGEKTTAKYIKVSNITQGQMTFSDDEGNFSIYAIQNDSILFSSSFFEEKKIVINKSHFDDIFVVELKEKINELDNVIVKSEVQPKEFNEKEFNNNINNQIKEDMKRNPHKYGAYPDENLIIKSVLSYIAKLFKKKREAPVKTISYGEFETLFSESHFFNDTLLITEMHIPEEYKYLFFNFCHAKNINADVLKKENHLLLLDALIKASIEFKEIIKNEKN